MMRDPWEPPKTSSVWGSACALRGRAANPPRTGLPVTTPFSPNSRRASSYEQAALRTKGRRTRLVNPGLALGSRITVLMPRAAAARTTGPPA